MKKMKKMMLILMVVLVACSMSLWADGFKKEYSIFMGAGHSVSDLEGLSIEAGYERPLGGNFYGQLLVDYYFDPYDLPAKNESMAYSLNFFGVYKFPTISKFRFFVKGGLHYSMLKQDWGWLGTTTFPSLGVAAGGGVEYGFCNSAFVYSGATVKTNFDRNDPHTWVKFSVGIGYRGR